jgi:hypothetical protein
MRKRIKKDPHADSVKTYFNDASHTLLSPEYEHNLGREIRSAYDCYIKALSSFPSFNRYVFAYFSEVLQGEINLNTVFSGNKENRDKKLKNTKARVNILGQLFENNDKNSSKEILEKINENVTGLLNECLPSCSRKIFDSLKVKVSDSEDTTMREMLSIANTHFSNFIGKRNELVEHNTRLVSHIARRYLGRGIDYLDLIQYGNIGLMKAAENFNAYEHEKFSPYAAKLIKKPSWMQSMIIAWKFKDQEN